MPDNNQSITINIQNSLDASKNFSLNNLLQQKAILKIKNILDFRLANIEKNTFNRKHDTITILGERGSGKTSLLLNLDTILNDYKDRLVFLNAIDPTLFETKQNILISIICLIANTIKEDDKQESQEWNEALIKLADGLKLLDGVGSDIIKSDLFDDGALILEKGLDHANSGLHLEEYFNHYINISLKLLGKDKKMFILVFDDIDTNIDKGWMVLETLRKYLTSSQIQVFVSGDWELYSSLVRMKQWENFNNKIIPEEEWSSKKTLVDQLEEQYLIKVLKPENRIYLENLFHLTKQDHLPILIEHNSYETTPINTIYSYITKELFKIKNKQQENLIFDLLKLLPLRTNMKIFYVHYENDNINTLINSISNVFVTNTSRYGFTHLDYENLSTEVILQEMAKKLYLISKKEIPFSNLVQFNMNLTDKDLNLLLMVINLHLIHTIDSKIHTFFEWFTRFTYLEKLGNSIFSQKEKISLLNDLNFNENIIMGDQLLLIGEITNYQGFRKVYGFNRFAKNKKTLGVDAFKKRYGLNEKFLIDVMSFKSGLTFHRENTYVSLLNIFSFLSEFLKQDFDSAKLYLFDIFNNAYELKDEEHLFSKTDKESLKKEIFSNKLFLSLLEWHKLKSDIDIFSISQINSIWKSFITRNNDELQNKKFDSLKDYLSTQILIFLNLLIKEVLVNNQQYRFYSTVNRINYLYRNIESAYGENYIKEFFSSYKKLDLFKFMYLCPIINCLFDDDNFIKPESRYWIGDDNKNNILNAFGNLGFQQNKDNSAQNKELDILNFINLSDLKKINKTNLSNFNGALEKIKNGEINNHIQLWNMVKNQKDRMTPTRASILKRLIDSVKKDQDD